MPIVCKTKTNRVAQAEFGDIAYQVMEHTFAIHRDFGRFFHEKIYKRELARRMENVEVEVPVEVSFESFKKFYALDVLVENCALFEFKAHEALIPRHRSQLMNYLLLADLEHGKLVNTRPESIQHEFVNCYFRLSSLRKPQVVDGDWEPELTNAGLFQETLVSVTRDWGTGLDLALYEEVAVHFLGGEETVKRDVKVGDLGMQPMRLLSSGVAFKLTALSERLDAFVLHARKLIAQSSLEAVAWVNIERERLTFSMIR